MFINQFGLNSVSSVCFTLSKTVLQILFLPMFTAEKYKDVVPDNTKNADNAAKNAEPLINLDGKCISA